MTADARDSGATRWAIRLDAGALDHAAEAELKEWLAGEPRREGALLRAQAALAYLDRGRALGSLDAKASEGGVRLRPHWFIGRRKFLIGTGSGIAAACAGVLALLPRRRTIDTGPGEVLRVPLADGSTAMLNTASRIAIDMAAEQRRVFLAEGEAWFQVAPDKARPFVVAAGDVRVRAVGTAFAVRRRRHGADVLVTEGTVETWIVGRAAHKRRITAGSRGHLSDSQSHVEVAMAPQEVDRALAWRTGELALDGETLAYAVSEINRYNVRKLEIADPALGAERIVGYFRTSEPENFGRAVAPMVGARVVIEGDTIRLEKTRP